MQLSVQIMKYKLDYSQLLQHFLDLDDVNLMLLIKLRNTVTMQMI